MKYKKNKASLTGGAGFEDTTAYKIYNWDISYTQCNKIQSYLLDILSNAAREIKSTSSWSSCSTLPSTTLL